VDVSPEYLISFFADDTYIQAEKRLESYIGHWIPVRDVEVVDISQSTTATLYVTTKNAVLLTFNVEWKSRLSVLRKGTKINVNGQIDSVSQFNILHLRNCEILYS